MSNSLNQDLNAIELLIQKGRFSGALNDIVNLKSSVKKKSQEFYQLSIWENYLGIKLGNYSKAIIKLDNLIESIKKSNYQKLILDAYLVKISILSEIGQYDEMISVINLGESLITKLDESIQKKLLNANYTFKKGRYFYFKGVDKTAKTLYEESLAVCDELSYLYLKAEVLISLSIMKRREGEKKVAYKLSNESLQISEENEFHFVKGRAFSNLAHHYNLEGKLDETLTYLQKGLEVLNEVGSIYELGRININLGVVHYFSGNLNTSMNYYQKALEYFHEVGSSMTIATTVYNIALIYNLQGKLREALESYKITLPLFQKFSNVSLITACYNSIGKVYFDLGLIEDAEIHLRLVYQLKNQITEVSLSKTLFYLVQILISLKKIDEANTLVNELEKISQEQENDVIKHRYLFLRALVRNTDKKTSIFEIEELLLQVISEPITDQEITINAIINYCYLLIKKYSQEKDIEVLERIKYYSERLSKLATKQQSKLLFAEFYWIKSIIASLENNKEVANEISNQASKMAKEMNFKRLLNKIMEFNLQN